MIVAPVKTGGMPTIWIISLKAVSSVERWPSAGAEEEIAGKNG